MAPILCYVTDRAALAAPGTDALLDVICRAIRAGVDWIQIREKNLSGGELAALARKAVAAAQDSSTRILINGRLDVAIAARAGGVHLGGDAPPVADVKQFIRRFRRLHRFKKHALEGVRTKQSTQSKTGFLIGASCHSLAEAQAAERDAAHYIFFGPVFPTPAKVQHGTLQGVARLEEVCRAARTPVLAIGGVTLENAPQCLRAGAAGIAAIRLFQESSDLDRIVTLLCTTSDETGQPS